MRRYYLFLSESPLDQEAFSKALACFKIEPEINFVSEKGCYFVGDSSFALAVEAALHSLKDSRIACLISHDQSYFSRKTLSEALGYFPNRVSYLSDIFLKQMSFGDFGYLRELSSIFRGLDKELLATGSAFLSSGLDIQRAAESLFVHRNTMTHRLDSIYEKTGLDIRDYHDALLLELYLKMSPQR
ncbi:MAG: helix-turn-helix domain-containing protein [Bacillota bacterium]|nr:helix-turn-helix domain-containing protein [Bacillota bacterium]